MSIITKNTKKLQLVKCPHCQLQVDRNTEPFIEHSKRYYHEACFKIRHAKIAERNQLIDYICYLYKIERPTGFMLKQIKEFEEIGYSLIGIQLTLKFFHEIQENPVIQSNNVGIGIVDYVYNDAREYFGNLSEIINHNSKIQIDNTEEIVYVKPPKLRKRKMIDLEGIF